MYICKSHISLEGAFFSNKYMLAMSVIYQLAISGFTDVIGCIDVTHFRSKNTNDYEGEYVNRKGFHSLNIQLVCDGDLTIVNCVIRWPGATYDSRMFSESPIYNQFAESNGE